MESHMATAHQTSGLCVVVYHEQYDCGCKLLLYKAMKSHSTAEQQLVLYYKEITLVQTILTITNGTGMDYFDYAK